METTQNRGPEAHQAGPDNDHVLGEPADPPGADRRGTDDGGGADIASEGDLPAERAPAPSQDLTMFYRSFEIKPYERYRVENRTPYLVHIVHDDPALGELVLPPLAGRIIQGARLLPFADALRLHRQRHEVFVGHFEERISFVARLVWVAWLALLAPLGIAIYGIVGDGQLGQTFVVATAAAVVVIVLVLVVSSVREIRRRAQALLEGSEAGDIAADVGGAVSDGNETARDLGKLVTLVVVLGVGALLPVIAILVATDTKDFVVLDGGLRVKAGLESRVVARVIQMIYTCVLSLFPALLFFQFDRLRAGSVRDQWVRALFRMDGRMRTIADVNATYGSAMYEASNNTDDSVRGLGGKNSPIIIATILIALGWTVLVVRTESFDFSGATRASQQVQIASEQAQRAEEAAQAAQAAATAAEANAALADASAAADAAQAALEATSEAADMSTQGEGSASPAPADSQSEPASDDAAGAADSPDATGSAADDVAAPTTLSLEEARAAAVAELVEAQQAVRAAAAEETEIQSTQFFQVLAPNPSASGMAFLGAYFFAVYLILRSYYRGDLRSKLYNQITARLITVVVIAYLINAIVFTNTDQQRVVWALAFLAGVVPTTVLDYVFHIAGSAVRFVAGDTFSADRPLGHIDGVDIYDAGRLESEGITDVTALAAGDLASVMLDTRLPIGRLVDWADQAAMMVVVATPGPKLDPRVRCLRTRGIRTGTDLLATIESGDRSTIEQCLQIPPDRGRHGWWNDRRERKAAAADEAATPPAVPADDTEGQADETAAPPAVPAGDTEGQADVGAMVEEVVANDVDMDELAAAIRRQPVMSQILQWRASALDDVDRCWIPLPDLDEPPLVSASYRGPRPAPASTTQAEPATAPGPA